MSLDALCKRHNLRLTTTRQQIFSVLQDAATPLTIGDITKRCPDVDRTSIHRTLVLFDRLDIITIVHIGWKTYYELVDPYIPHHHHLYCIRCKNAAPLHVSELEKLVVHIGEENGFYITRHLFELEGVCQKCQHELHTPRTTKS